MVIDCTELSIVLCLYNVIIDEASLSVCLDNFCSSVNIIKTNTKVTRDTETEINTEKIVKSGGVDCPDLTRYRCTVRTD